MKDKFNQVRLTAMLVVITIGTCGWALETGNLSVAAEDVTTTGSQSQPVDDDMHHFMEYVFEPNYKRLKALMAAKPKDKQTWKSIKGDSLTLAECANLLLTRASDEDADQWHQIRMPCEPPVGIFARQPENRILTPLGRHTLQYSPIEIPVTIFSPGVTPIDTSMKTHSAEPIYEYKSF